MPPTSCDCAPSPPPDARAANALCPNRRPPRVAVCVVGGARTFVKEQAWRSLRRNLVEGLGGVGLAAGSTAPDVHFHLKTIDDEPKKKQQEWHFDRLDVSRAGDATSAETAEREDASSDAAWLCSTDHTSADAGTPPAPAPATVVLYSGSLRCW